MIRVVLWWFLLLSASGVGTVVGPFQFASTCRDVQTAAIKWSAHASPCWDDGRRPAD